MSTIKGLGISDIEPQPGFSATRDENGGWTGRHSFAIRRTSYGTLAGNFAKGTSVTSLDTDLPFSFSFLKIVTTEVSSEEGDFIMMNVTLAGSPSATYGDDGLGGQAEPTYALRGSLQDAPLSIHPKWAALSDLEKQALGEMISSGLVYDPPTGKVGTKDERTFWAEETSEGTEYVLTAADAKAFAVRIARGETTYLRPVFTWTESTAGNDELTAAQLNKLGNIATPRGDPPDPGGTRDWMLTSAFQEETGDLFRTELEWTLSEKGGHASFLYDE